MIKDLIEIIKNLSLRHKGVRTFRYQDNIFNNAQNNFKTFQVYVDTVSIHQINITTNIFTSEFQIYILGQPNDKEDNRVEDVQTNAYTVAVDLIAALDNWSEYNSVLTVHDYSILTLSEYTDDKSAGVKLSLVLEVPNPLNLCSYEENFNAEPYPEDPDIPVIDIPTKEVGELDIKPIHLPRNRQC